MSRVLPILFNTDMVRAILDDRKTATRRIVKYKYSNTEMKMHTDKRGTRLIEIQKDVEGETYKKLPDGRIRHKLLPYIEKNPPYETGDILYVRETWAFIPCIGCNGDYARPGSGMNCYDTQAVEYDDGESISDGCFIYRADCKMPERIVWHPSIHMPKKAAHIWLKVTDVRAERLHDMTLDDFLSEGVVIRPEAFNDPENAYMQARNKFARIWDSTTRKSQTDLNPWVWAIKFERCKKPEEIDMW